MQSNIFLAGSLPLGKDSLTVNYNEFDPARLTVGTPVADTAKRDENVKFNTCSLSYTYDVLRKQPDGSEKLVQEKGPVKITFPRLWAFGGVSVFELTDKKTNEKRTTRSIGFKVDLKTPEGLAIAECIRKIICAIVKFATGQFSSMAFQNVKEVTDCAAIENPDNYNFVINKWGACPSPLEIKKTPSGQPDVSIPYKFWSSYNPVGKYKTVVCAFDDNDQLREVSEDLKARAAFEARATLVINDWFIGAKPKLRSYWSSVLITDVAPKSGSYDDSNAYQAELENRRKMGGNTQFSENVRIMMMNRDAEQPAGVTPPETTASTTTTTTTTVPEPRIPDHHTEVNPFNTNTVFTTHSMPPVSGSPFAVASPFAGNPFNSSQGQFSSSGALPNAGIF